jgi:hypothetical protein
VYGFREMTQDWFALYYDVLYYWIEQRVVEVDVFALIVL